jgi:hypothetical protein
MIASMEFRFWLAPAIGLLAGLTGGCTCGGDTTVPFHGAGPPLRPVDPAVGLVPLEAATYPDGTRQIDVESRPVRIEEGAIRASALFDFDRDGDRDALVVVLGAPGAAARVLYAERRGAELAPLVSLASRASLSIRGAGRETSCAPSGATVTPLSDALVIATVESLCNDEDAPRLASTWVLSADERPRALELFELAGRAEGEGLAFAAADRDHDGHDDLEVEVRIATPSAPVTATLTWMNRAAGLAREGEQPEPTLATLATQSRELVRRSPEEAIVVAERAIALRDAVCREAERPRLFLGGARGVPCGTSVGRAYAVRAAALARRLGAGEPMDALALSSALEAFVGLDHQGVSIREGDRALVRESWLRVATVPPARLRVHRSGDARPLGDGRTPRLSSLAFLDERRLLVRGEPARVLHIEGDALVPDAGPERPELAESRVLDPDHELVLAAIGRSCEGTVVVIAPVDGPGRREILVSPRPAPAVAECPTMPEGHRADDGGFVPLGWAPSGLVLARGTELTMVPLDATGAPAGPPSVLDPETAAPAPLVPGAAVSEAQGFALAFPFGIVVVDRVRRRLGLYRDEDFAVPQGLPIDVAVSPSLERAAWICGGSICWADLRASEAPAEPTPSGPPEMPPGLGLQQSPTPEPSAPEPAAE